MAKPSKSQLLFEGFFMIKKKRSGFKFKLHYANINDTERPYFLASILGRNPVKSPIKGKNEHT